VLGWQVDVAFRDGGAKNSGGKRCNRFLNNYKAEPGLKQHLICGVELVHFHFSSTNFFILHYQPTLLLCMVVFGMQVGMQMDPGC